MENEIWKSVVGYEGLYEVSNLGRVKSCERKVAGKNGNMKLIKERILKQDLYEKGYYRVQLFKEGKKQNKKVHRVVAEAFLQVTEGCDTSKKEVTHRDNNKLNNNLENLVWKK
jgi:hypothetical protein